MYYFLPTLLALLIAALPAPLYAQVNERAAPLLDWDELPALATRHYNQNAGKAAAAQLQATRAEADRLPGRLQSVSVGAQLDLSLAASAVRPPEHGVTAGVNIALGDWRELERASLTAHMDYQRAVAAQARWRLLEQLAQAYAQWWSASILLEHVQDDLRELTAALERYKQASAQDSTALALVEVEVMLGRLALERAQLEQRRQASHAELIAILGQDTFSLPTKLTPPTLAQLEQEPWSALERRLEHHPDLEALRAEHRSIYRRAEAAEALFPWSLQLGGQLMTQGLEAWWWTQNVSLVIPLANPGKAQAARHRLEASANLEQQRVAALALKTQWQARSRQYMANLNTLKVHAEALLQPMMRRQRLLDAAAASNQIPALRAIEARVELHELEHQQLLQLAQLRLEHYQAQLILSEGASKDGR